ncbi:type II toxin-antitoxin system VapC family toxin [Pseudomonas fragi]|jgi:toxin FitB|uniref:Ribonuclease VapC n=1 Tax=Pseudomonas fragi TaxID=296 RepID=A0A9Q5FQB0_PSEFR|nr:type II toxin-antitoxin system VapC family toxin [Pseudomonas fragi]MBM1198980.1 type II toxin-antitoxin system VapC family toxin [Pseudomonas fragi]NNB24496.1 type II toxin-antitoxin system VapC family toxin [Pseudomonas fragi]NNB51305.1 type II toxin-antitoxin system VapC family toxin [Pseudomonas fragi]PAA08643.1 VapC toxin family PIN domain ribonuclease [Pseudomonas fragi]WRT59390.1 type II toxin-antitoxin system VapC family toxin [Pseudomonas fragi]
MFLLDTNVVSELRKTQADPAVVAWARSVPAYKLYISAITLLEIETGILRLERRDPGQAATLRNWLEVHVMAAFAGRVLSVDGAVARRCARLHVPDRSNECDALIAATALVHDMTVVTRNTRDFAFSGAPVLNPWEL